MMADEASFENALIDDMRAHDGAVTGGPLKGHPLLIMTSRGAKTGERRRAILTWSRDGDSYVVAGTAGGSRKDPSWLKNLVADPDVTIETGNRTFAARATIVDESERSRLWERHVAALPWFAAYPEQTGRDIPMVRLTPLA
jgi:deazaflavin-dependent oxidoreductase (nitroreductase family)